MKKDISLSLSLGRLPALLSGFIKRFHIMIYTLTVVIGVLVAMFMLNSLLSQTLSGDTEQPTAQTPAFDQETIERINNFNTAGTEGDTFSLPPGRINPLAS